MLGGKELDLHGLYCQVTSRGGLEKVQCVRSFFIYVSCKLGSMYVVILEQIF
jgi:hypothetical protein